MTKKKKCKKAKTHHEMSVRWLSSHIDFLGQFEIVDYGKSWSTDG